LVVSKFATQLVTGVRGAGAVELEHLTCGWLGADQADPSGDRGPVEAT
jgi:hypothetical protein